jgi:hypothetical protein
MLEGLAVNIAGLSFDVHKNVEGPLGAEQTRGIADLLEKYKRREIAPRAVDCEFLRKKPDSGKAPVKRHDSDYYLISKTSGEHVLIDVSFPVPEPISVSQT